MRCYTKKKRLITNVSKVATVFPLFNPQEVYFFCKLSSGGLLEGGGGINRGWGFNKFSPEIGTANVLIHTGLSSDYSASDYSDMFITKVQTNIKHNF